MGRFVLFLLLPLCLFGATVKPYKWNNGESFLTFLERKKLPLRLYYNLDKEDKTLVEDIPFRANCHMLVDDNNKIEQVLIPVNDELQLHIYKNYKKRYAMQVIPIVSEYKKEVLYLPIKSIPYDDILKATGSTNVATQFVKMFKNRVDFRKGFRAGDRIVMVYNQKYRLGKPFSMPDVLGAMAEVKGKKVSVYKHKDGRFYDEKGAQQEKFLFKIPIHNPRITSHFTKARFHPILKRYRAHLGTDFGARPGTPVLATGDGVTNFVGVSRGYGNVIKIKHSTGHTSLYAHLKGFRSGLRSGLKVKQGETIGYVGNTGLSSGPHLHFGMYIGSEAINPLSVMKKVTEGFSGKELAIFKEIRANMDAKFAKALKEQPIRKPYFDFQGTYYVDFDTLKPVPF